MKNNKKQIKRSKLFILKFFLLLIISNHFQPAKAFAPYFYEPNQEELKKTSITIAKRAAQLIQLGVPKEAIRYALLAVSIEPNDARLWGILSEAQARVNLLEEAKTSLGKAKKINPTNPNIYFAEAALYLLQEESSKAIEIIKNGLKLDKKNSGAYFQLGNARIMEMQPILALKEFESAIKLKPLFWEAINNQGIIHFELGQKKKAILKWRKALAINKNAEPMLALAAALNSINPNNSESINLAKEALNKNPNYVYSFHQKEQLWGRKLRQATKKLLKKQELVLTVKKAMANSDVTNTNEK